MALTTNKDKIAKWFYSNFTTHTDWTGTRVETSYETDNVYAVIEKFINDCCEDN